MKINTKTVTKDSSRLKKPKSYKVILLNDDYTTFEFVIDLLTSVFRKTLGEAEQLAKQIDKEGSGIATVTSYEIAETKIAISLVRAKEKEFPLILEMEPE